MTTTLDRVKGSLARFIETLTRRVDFLALYPSKVVGQNADGTLELQPENSTMPGMSKVPIRHGLPGVTVKVTNGARVLLGFENGEPRSPIALIWNADPSHLTEIDFGSSPTSFIALATQTKAALDAIVSAFNSHVHTSTPSGSPTSAPMTPPAVPLSITASTDVASTILKSK